MKSPIIKGERVVLRPIKLADAQNYVRWFSDGEVMRYFHYAMYKITLKKEQKWIREQWRKQDAVNWVVEVNGKHIGGTGITLHKKEKTGTWGIILGDKSEWGKGFAVEVINLCADYYFKKFNGERFELIVEMGNEKALKAYKKAGFKFEGAKRSCGYNPLLKKRIDIGFMSILREEWLKKNK